MPIKQKLKEKYFPQTAGYTRREQLGYCAGAFGNVMGQDSVDTFSDKFLRSFMRIESGKMTLTSNILMIVGIPVATLVGYILDTPVKPGRKSPAKLFTLAMPIPFAVATMMLFVVPTGDAFKNFLWALLFRLIYRISDSFYDASLNTLSLRTVNNVEDRKNFFTLGTLASMLGSALPGWLISMAVGSTKDANAQVKIYFFFALAFCVIGLLTMPFPFFTMTEKTHVDTRPEKTRLSWDRQMLSTIVHNRTFLVVEAATFFEQVRQISYKLLNYIYEDVLDDFQMKGIVDVISGVLSAVALLWVPSVSSRFAPRTILSGGFAYTGVFYAIMGLLGRKFSPAALRRKKLLIGLMIGLAGMPNQAINASKKILVGDSTDYMEWFAEKRYGRPIHAEGFITMTQSILGTVFDVIRTNIYNIVFGKFGYIPHGRDENGGIVRAVQSKKTLHGIFTMFIVAGVVGNFLAALTYQLDNFTGERKEKITAELLQMREERQKLADERKEAILAADGE